MMAKYQGPLLGELTVPGDKSISHRALILGALSIGVTKITGLLEAQDVLNTARVLTSLGAVARKTPRGWEVVGRGVSGLSAPDGPLDFGNSGTGVRLMMGVLSGHPFEVKLKGDASLSRRPMGRVLRPLRQMGLEVVACSGAQQERQRTGLADENSAETLPLKLRGLIEPIPITYTLPVPSAQVKSAVLLAGLHAPGTTTIIEPVPTRDHTERMLGYFGARLSVSPENGGTRIALLGQPELSGRRVVVPADPSSAAFLVAGAVIVPGSDVTITNVLMNKTRFGFYETLMEMGADLTFINKREEAGEPIADIMARASTLKAVLVPPERAPSMIDEYPVLAVVAAFAQGVTRMEGLCELRVKESDRLSATVAGLLANGVEADVNGDSLIVHGTGGKVAGGGVVETHLDHRMAMAFLTMGLASEKAVGVDDVSMIATSFPEFQSLISDLGGALNRLNMPGQAKSNRVRNGSE